MKILKTIDLKGFGEKYQGKTRDFYIRNDKRIIISTDRISAFDINLGYIPQKGKVLNLLSAFWFDKTKNIIPNHLISVPHPNAMIVKNAKLIPIEMIVRAYITGVTGTSIWGSYEKGHRIIYGIKFPDGLKKNQKLPHPVITPTTKAMSGHDKRLTKDQIMKKRIVSTNIYSKMEKISLKLFERGTNICSKKGLMLVDTKYEFGLDKKNKLILIDEIHTPDSSRFWIKKTYKQRLSERKEPENFDKELLRIWFKKRGYIGEGVPPKMPKNFIDKVSKRYIDVFKKITGQKLMADNRPIESTIK